MSESKSKFASGLLIVLILVALLGGLALFAWWLGGDEEVETDTIVEVDVQQALVEFVSPNDPFAAFVPRMTVRQFVEALHAAADDDNVNALVARVAPVGMGLAQVEELRDAVLAFRESGKPTVAYADTFGELVGGNSAYYLASAFEHVYIQPSGDVGLTGVMVEQPFLAGTLEKIGVEPYFSQRYEYKTAPNLFTESGFTEAGREAYGTFVDSILDHMVATIAEARGLSEDTVRSLMDDGPVFGPEAVEAGLVDELLYRDQVYDRVRELGGLAADGGNGEESDPFLSLKSYRKRADGPWDEGPDTIAVVYGLGGVTRGESESSPFADPTMGSETVTRALRQAVDDDDVKAILFRVDSPGGSYVASDSIWREVVRAGEEGKPVVVSMGNLAASGGYFVAMPAAKIVAHPGTLTGSIGVFGGKFDTSEMWNKLGITWDSVQNGDHADMWSAVKPFDEDEKEKLDEWLDRVYEDFTTKVADGRDLPIETVREIAKGRVWAGVDALELGLVDELGGFPTALRLAREEAGLDADTPVRVRTYPAPKSTFEALQDMFGSSAAQARAVAALAEQLGPVVRTLHEHGLLGEPQPAALRAPVVGVEE